MTDEQHMVRAFHERFGAAVSDCPTWPGPDAHRSTVLAIEEGLAKFRNAGEAGSLVEAADALADLLYAVYGAAVTFGVDLQPVFAEVHRANMSKSGVHCKGDGYSPPRVLEVLTAQAS